MADEDGMWSQEGYKAGLNIRELAGYGVELGGGHAGVAGRRSAESIWKERV